MMADEAPWVAEVVEALERHPELAFRVRMRLHLKARTEAHFPSPGDLVIDTSEDEVFYIERLAAREQVKLNALNHRANSHFHPRKDLKFRGFGSDDGPVIWEIDHG